MRMLVLLAVLFNSSCLVYDDPNHYWLIKCIDLQTSQPELFCLQTVIDPMEEYEDKYIIFTAHGVLKFDKDMYLCVKSKTHINEYGNCDVTKD